MSRLLLLSSVLLLAACATFMPALDPPKIRFLGLRDITPAGGIPTFEIKLQVLNPNDQTLNITGISYSIYVRNRELITGVANDIPPIGGYSEGEVAVKASLQLLELVHLLTSLGQTSAEPLTYRLSAKIDFRGLVPTQRIEESGELQLR